MKKIILISMLTVISCAFSCQKATTGPTTVAPIKTPPTYSEIKLGMVLISRRYCPEPGKEFSLTGIKFAVIKCSSATIDSLAGINVIESPVDINPCDSAGSAKVIYHYFKIQNGADNFIELYDSTSLIVRYKLNPATPATPFIYDYYPIGTMCFTNCGNLLAPIR